MIIQNAIRVKKKIINSVYIHDYLKIKVKGIDNKYYDFVIDGGLDYFRSNDHNIAILKNPNDYEDLCLTTSSSIENIKDKLLWGTYGKKDKKKKKIELKSVKLIDCSTEHLQNILNDYERDAMLLFDRTNRVFLFIYIIKLILEERKNKTT